MRRLLWKEFRERRLWGATWVASVVGVGALAHAGYIGGMGQLSPWIKLPYFVSLAAGASAYVSELTGNRSAFAFSRPVSWKMMMLAKLLYGILIAVVAAALGAIAFRIFCPQEYLAFATFPQLVGGAGRLAWMMGSVYLAGLLCSTCLPGEAGGLLTVIASMLVVGGAESASHAVFKGLNERILGLWLRNGQLVGTAVAAIVTARFGLTLSTRARAGRYAAVFLVVFAGMGALGLTVPNNWITARLRSECEWSSVSPSGRYAFVRVGKCANEFFGLAIQSGYFDSHDYLVRLSDGKTVNAAPLGVSITFSTYRHIPVPGGSGAETMPLCNWTDEDTMFYYSPPPDGRRAANATGEIRTIKMAADGTLVSQSIRVGGKWSWLLPSADGRFAMLVTYGTGTITLEFVDIEGARKLDEKVEMAAAYWWQSDREVGYTDQEGERHIIRVAD